MITKRKINTSREGGLIIAKGDLIFKKTTKSQKDWEVNRVKQKEQKKKKIYA